MDKPPIMKRGLVIGIGNVIRKDDGLGPQTVALLDEIGFNGHDIRTMALPQIDITLVNELASVEYVLFVDARVCDSEEKIRIVHCRQTEHNASLSHTSHALTIPTLIEITRELYGMAPDCYIVAPKGYDFSIGENLSPGAENNRQLAARRITDLIGAISGGLQTTAADEIPLEITC
jgi:hydrogenase maturation protease